MFSELHFVTTWHNHTGTEQKQNSFVLKSIHSVNRFGANSILVIVNQMNKRRKGKYKLAL